MDSVDVVMPVFEAAEVRVEEMPSMASQNSQKNILRGVDTATDMSRVRDLLMMSAVRLSVAFWTPSLGCRCGPILFAADKY
jgi:hypothetical protein